MMLMLSNMSIWLWSFSRY